MYKNERLKRAKRLSERLDFKRFICQELNMDIIKPEDLSDDDCFNMILEYTSAASPEELDALSLATCDFLEMIRDYESYKQTA